MRRPPENGTVPAGMAGGDMRRPGVQGPGVQGTDRAWLIIALGVILLSAVVQARFLHFSFARGGGHWVQGDWLINLAAGPVRRGPFGEALIRLSLLSGLPILTVLAVFQAVMAGLLYGLTLWLVALQRHRVAVLAVFSAAFFVFVVGTLPASGLRKEVFGLVAILLLALPGGGQGRILASALLLVAGAVGHELGVLFLPGWLIALYLLRKPDIDRAATRTTIALTVLGVGAAALYAVRFPGLEDATPICAAIRAAGPVAPDFCTGAIDWLARDDPATAQVAARLAALGWYVWPSLLIFGLAFLPLMRLMWLCGAPRSLVVMLIVSMGPFLLLYPLGFDWGRWVMLQVSIPAIILLGMLVQERLTPRGQPGGAELTGWLVLALASGVNLDILPLPLAFPSVVLAIFAG